MPKELEKRLAKRAKEKGLKGKRKDAYIYGGMRSMGWKPSTQVGGVRG